MKFFTLFGGFLGFFLTLIVGLLSGNDPGPVLVNSAIGCLIGALLFRGFRHIVTCSAREVLMEKARLKAQELPREDDASSQATPASP